jgi:hypothetical protein
MQIGTMPIYRQLFDFLCLASIAISVAEASRGRRVVQAELWAKVGDGVKG